MRRLSYRNAMYAFVFVGLWTVLGFLFLMTPIPGALGIGGQLISAWILIDILAFGVSGAMLAVAAFNGIFPPVESAPARKPAPARTGHVDATSQAWSRPLTSRSRDR